MKSRNNFCFLNGKYIKEKEARFSVNDVGLLRGYGVFDFLVTNKGRPVLLSQHLKRLYASAGKIGIKPTQSKKDIKNIIEKLLKLNNFPESMIRIIVTGGNSQDGFHPGKKPTLLILVKEYKKPKQEIYTRGVKLITHNYLREEPRSKSLNYVNYLKSLEKIKNAGAFNVLYTHNGHVHECATSNIFIVKNKVLLTPKDDILLGTTRSLVIKLASKSYKTIERVVTTEELFKADEVFITSSAKGIVPVVQIDNKKIANQKPGQIFKNIIKIYNSFLDSSQQN